MIIIKKIIWLGETILLIIIGLPMALLPLPMALCCGEVIGWLFYHIFANRREIAIDNIKNTVAVGGITINETPRELAKKTYLNFGRSFAEVVKLYYGLGQKIIRKVEFVGFENFYAAQVKKRGSLFITGHCGNWELLAASCGPKVGSFGIIIRPLDNIYLSRIIAKIRVGYGNTLINKKGAIRGILNAARNNQAVAVLIDQASNSEEGLLVNFLGRKAWATKMPALIAAKTNMPIIPIFIHRKGDKHIVTMGAELPLLRCNDEASLQKDTQMISDAVADYVKQYPAEWLWIHKRWKRA
jgi:KDO2-lipid IV(A) lauroyltransferase